jgi:CopG family nickel-responsive transcriptional regulator
MASATTSAPNDGDALHTDDIYAQHFDPGEAMQRVTISIDDALAREFDALCRQRGYASRSEAVRDLLRDAVRAPRTGNREGFCVANFSYVYNHHERGMAALLATTQHEQHDLVLATTHVHLDHDHCLEALMLKGPVDRVCALTDAIQAERGVRHGALNVIPVEPGDHHQPGDTHDHDTHSHDGAMHLSPRAG